MKIALAILALALAIVVGLSIGTSDVSLSRALFDAASHDRVIVVSLRLPRVLLGAVAGAGLAAVGVAFQALLRNPLAEPYVLGVSGGAALGATIAIALGVASSTVLGAAVLPLAALAGGFGATVLVYALARRGGTDSGTSILLAGVVVNAIASAAITFVKTLVPERARRSSSSGSSASSTRLFSRDAASRLGLRRPRRGLPAARRGPPQPALARANKRATSASTSPRSSGARSSPARSSSARS